MRFIGSKAALLEQIDQVVQEQTDGTETVFCDLFAGTGVVAQYFKSRYRILSNDLLHFSYAIQKATIENNAVPAFDGLRGIGIADPFRFLEEVETGRAGPDDQRFFIARNYAPGPDCQRMYLSAKNAERIDFIRNTIEAWRRAGLLSEGEYYYLLAGLVEAVPSVSNITGTYGAYLKKWDKRAFKELELVRLPVTDNGRVNRCYQQDANELLGEIQGDILYLDPPYNSRQYASNYHLLETVSRYDHPDIQGVTGVRSRDERSAYCIKKEVLAAFEDLIAKAKFRHILLSYSSDGLMSAEEIEGVLKKYGLRGSFRRYEIPYRKYKSKIGSDHPQLSEYIFYIRKRVPGRRRAAGRADVGENAGGRPAGGAKQAAGAGVRKYVKSPLNYIGGKYKLLPQLLPLFPADIATFVDLFSGGANVAINVNADRILCNDINTKIIEMFRAFQALPTEEILARIHRNIERYGLSKTNEEGFLRFRADYNVSGDPIDLYTLTCFSFNYQFRFNSAHQYNNPFGRNRSRFSENMEQNLVAFLERLHRRKITFTARDFTQVPLEQLGPQDLIYCDPPYLITTGTYNDGNRGFKDWGEREERQLYDYLDRAAARHIRFALSNVMEHKGRVNTLLEAWSRKYRVVELSSDYSNASYNTRRGESREVLILND